MPRKEITDGRNTPNMNCRNCHCSFPGLKRFVHLSTEHSLLASLLLLASDIRPHIFSIFDFQLNFYLLHVPVHLFFAFFIFVSLFILFICLFIFSSRVCSVHSASAASHHSFLVSETSVRWSVYVRSTWMTYTCYGSNSWLLHVNPTYACSLSLSLTNSPHLLAFPFCYLFWHSLGVSLCVHVRNSVN